MNLLGQRHTEFNFFQTVRIRARIVGARCDDTAHILDALRPICAPGTHSYIFLFCFKLFGILILHRNENAQRDESVAFIFIYMPIPIEEFL